MLIYRPYETKILMPMPISEWRTPNQSQKKDCFGNEDHTRFRLTVRCHDGHPRWVGWFDDRDDFDAFLWAIATGTIQHERELWRLPTPNWYSDLDETPFYAVDTIQYLTNGAGSNQTWTSPRDWGNRANKIEGIAGGGGGGAVNNRLGYSNGTGGGGGAYSRILNFIVANPGVTTATYMIGDGGNGSNGDGNGGTGDSTWFNTSSWPGTGSDNAKLAADRGDGGLGSTSYTVSGGAGGDTSGWGQTKYSGGRGGNASNNLMGTGGGGAAGPSSNGGNGQDNGNNGGYPGSGTFGDGSGGGAGWGGDGEHGSAIEQGHNGNYYGGAGGGAASDAVAQEAASGGDGRQGIIGLTYTPRARFFGAPAFF